MMLHAYTPQPIYLLTINLLHLMNSEIYSGQDFKGKGHYSKVKGQLKVTP